MLDPTLNCSYAYFRVGQYVGFSGWEKLREGNVHFAGEHCSQDFQGYMEGGASEGVRAATEVSPPEAHVPSRSVVVGFCISAVAATAAHASSPEASRVRDCRPGEVKQGSSLSLAR